jgi:hypothetical protein
MDSDLVAADEEIAAMRHTVKRYAEFFCLEDINRASSGGTMISMSGGRSRARLRRVSLLSVVVLAGTHVSAFADPVAKITNNGAYASAFGIEETGCVATYVSAERSGSKTATQTWLYYDVYDLCASQSIALG